MSKVIMGGVHLASQQDVEAIKKVIDEQYPTLYKYRGNVDTYDNLLLITDSAIGDVYNVLENDKNFAWDGEKWDDLGGMFQIDTSSLLKSTGHVDTVEDLPVTQLSGEVGEHPSTLETDLTLTNVNMPNLSDLPNLTTHNGIYTPYVFGFYVDSKNYFFVSTDNPELIDGFSYSLDGNFNIYTNAGTSIENNFKVYHACHDGMINTMIPAGDPEGCALVLPDMGTAIEDFNAGAGYEHVCLSPLPILGDMAPGIAMAYLGGKGPIRIFGNLPNSIKYKPHLRYALKAVDGLGMPPTSWEYLPEDATRDSLILAFKNNYTYTDGMEALRFDEQGNAYWITDEDGPEENDVATVGDDNAIYVNEPNKGWTPWAKPKDVDTSMFLKPKGHLSAISALPSMGQASGTIGSNPVVDNNDLTKLRDGLVKQTSSKYMLFLDLGIETWTGGSKTDAYLKLETAYPEVIESLALNTSKNGVIKINATSKKPVTVTMHRVAYSKVIANSSPSSYYMYSSSIELTSTYYIWTQLAVQGIYGNLTTPLKYANYSYRAYGVNQSNGSVVAPSQSYGDSLQLGFREDGYIYNNGMTMLTFDEDYNAHWVLADPQEEPNVLYTVGETNEAFLSDSNKWIHLSSGMYKLYTVSIGKPAVNGGSTDISGIGQSVINAIMDAAKYGKTPVLYSSNYYGLFFPLFSIEDVKTKTSFEFCGPTYSQYSSSNTGQVGMPYARFNVSSNTNGELKYNQNSIGAGQLMLMNSSYFLSTYNTKAYTPTDNYHPATKIYVDNLIAEVNTKIGDTEAVLDEILNEPELVEDDIQVPDAG